MKFNLWQYLLIRGGFPLASKAFKDSPSPAPVVTAHLRRRAKDSKEGDGMKDEYPFIPLNIKGAPLLRTPLTGWLLDDGTKR